MTTPAHKTFVVPTNLSPADKRIEKALAQIDKESIIDWVPVKDMIDPGDYGRPVSIGQIGRMAATGFNLRAVGILTLSMRGNGKFAVIDGNHRRYLAEHLGIPELLARVFIDLSYAEEAELYEQLGTVKPQTALDRFRSRVAYGDPVTQDIVARLAKYDLFIPSNMGSKSINGVTSVRSLERTYETLGPHGFSQVIAIIHETWYPDLQAYTGHVIGGMRQFWLRYRDTVDLMDLIAKLKKISPTQLLRNAKELSTGTDNADNMVGKQILRIYNSRRRSSHLPEWQERFATHENAASASRSRGSRVLAELEKARKAKE